jgi:prolyl oligopeptidase
MLSPETLFYNMAKLGGNTMKAQIQYPKTKKVDSKETFHGIEVSDPYQWLEGDSDEIGCWLADQNTLTRSFLDKVDVRENIKQRLLELFRIDTVGIPVPKRNHYFFVERKAEEDLGVLYVQDGLRDEPRVLVDPNTLSGDKTTILHGWSPSKDGTLLAYGLSEAANDQATVYVMDVSTGENLPDVIPSEVYPSPHSPITWSHDKSGFWYSRRHPDAPNGEEKFHQKLYFHKLDDDYTNDPMIFGEDIAKEDIPWIQTSSDGRYLLVTVYVVSGGKEKTALFLKDNQNPEKGFTPVVEGIEAVFFGEMHRDTIYVMTNHNSSLWKVLSVNVEDIGASVDEWEVVIPESEHKIEGFKTIKDRLFVETLENVCSALKVYTLDGEFLSTIELPTLGSLDAITGGKEGNELFFGFSSFFVPQTIYRLDVDSGEYLEFKKAEAGIDTEAFTTKQIWYSTKDKTQIPMFLVYKKGLEQNGKNPTMLYGYGGFNVSITPAFQKTIMPFLESGGLYAVANIRGGGEFGEKWHEAGMRDNKQNVFDDFVAAADWLITNQYTNQQHLSIFGWSNGGLLVGTTMIQRPDLCKAVVVGAPVIDMLRYHQFHGGRHWIPDYGCAEESEDFEFLHKYSPYHNVKDEGSYPSTLIVAADKDDRVHPMHAFKFAARLQEANSSGNPILLRVETKAGHGGAASVNKVAEQFADIWAFVFWQLGM